MNIFIIGGTNSGKSTFSKKLNLYLEDKNYDVQIIEASSFLLKQNDIPTFTKENRTKVLTNYSTKLLKTDISFIGKKIKTFLSRNKFETNIIVGIRNPADFILLFNPNDDIVFISNCKFKTDFEKSGIKSIKTYLKFLSKNKLIKNNVYEKDEFNKINLEKII